LGFLSVRRKYKEPPSIVRLLSTASPSPRYRTARRAHDLGGILRLRTQVLQSISKTRELSLGKAWHCLGEPLRLVGVKDHRDVRSACSPDTAAESARRDRTQKRLLKLQQRPVSINLTLLKLGLFSAQPGRIVMSSKKNNTVTGFLQRMRGYHIAL